MRTAASSRWSYWISGDIHTYTDPVWSVGGSLEPYPLWPQLGMKALTSGI
jgi:hypothetical protein